MLLDILWAEPDRAAYLGVLERATLHPLLHATRRHVTHDGDLFLGQEAIV